MNAADLTPGQSYALRDFRPSDEPKKYRVREPQTHWRQVRVVEVLEHDKLGPLALIEAGEYVGCGAGWKIFPSDRTPTDALRRGTEHSYIPDLGLSEGQQGWTPVKELQPLDTIRDQQAKREAFDRAVEVCFDAGLIRNRAHRSADVLLTAKYVEAVEAELEDLRARVCRADELILEAEAEERAALAQVARDAARMQRAS